MSPPSPLLRHGATLRKRDGLSGHQRACAVAPAAACLLVALTAGCDDGNGRALPTPAPMHGSFDAIPDAPLQGKLRSLPFSVKSARYTIDRRLGYEQVDITLSAAVADGHCGALRPKDAPSVWLRRKGAEPVSRADLRLQPDAPASWEVHYQLRHDGQWVGSGQAAALLVLRPSDKSTTVTGGLSACFADGHASCIAGTFSARQCPVLLDMPVRGNEPVEQVPPDRQDASAAPTPEAGAAGSAGEE